ncbi:MAG: BMP family ABC transporter substrate-binding protein [Actinobacteria bacterium]|nr:BMP family ABC transporter substrate-binding protein [Actinomycetota bacterium]
MQKKNFGRVRTVAAFAATALIASVMVSVPSASAAPKVTVGIAYDLGGRAQPGFNQLAYIGAKAYSDKNMGKITIKELQAQLSDTDDIRAERLRLLIKAGSNPVVAVGFLYAGALAKVAKEYPKVKFGIVDDGSVVAPNVEWILFKEEEGSFLVGAIAALKSKTGNIGFIGGVKIPLIQKFEAGYIAGAKQVNPKIKIQSTYISLPPDFSGFNDPAKGFEAASGMFQNGADVVYSAAGGTGGGAHKAAYEQGKMSIGVDADEAKYESNAAYKSVIITSMLKRVDTGVASFISDVMSKKFKAGSHIFGVSNNGVGYTTTGGKINSIVGKVNALAKKISSGAIKVPSVPKE